MLYKFNVIGPKLFILYVCLFLNFFYNEFTDKIFSNIYMLII